MFDDSEELNLAISEVIALGHELSEFDLTELKAGRITLGGARFEAAFAHLMAIGGLSDGVNLDEYDWGKTERDERRRPK